MNFEIAGLSQLDRPRFSSYKSNLDFYNGSQWASKSKNRQLVFNYARIAVDKITSYLMNDLNFSFDPLPGADPALAKRAEDLVYQVLDLNSCAELDYTTEIDTAILGDGCYKVTWDALEKRIRITAPDVNGLYAWWTGDNLSRIYRVASRYSLSSDEAALVGERLDVRHTPAVTSASVAGNVAAAILSKSGLDGAGGRITIPPHCGLELWDVVSIVDIPANQSANYRVCSYTLEYDVKQGIFIQRISF